MNETMLCKKCLLDLPLDNFRIRKDNGHYEHTCKKCKTKQHYEYIKTHKENCKEINKRSYIKNREKRLEHQKEYNNKNKEKRSIKAKQRRLNNLEYYREYARENCKKHRKQITQHEKERMQNDKLFNIKKRVRQSIRMSFKKKGYIKPKITENILGCDYQFFMDYLLNTFKENYGYEWDGKEIVHIDHIIPLAQAQNEEEVMKLCHYTNLQLLKAKDNLYKSDKLNYKIKEENLCI